MRASAIAASGLAGGVEGLVDGCDGRAGGDGLAGAATAEGFGGGEAYSI